MQRLPMLIERLSSLHDFSREGISEGLYVCTEQPNVDHTDPAVSVLARYEGKIGQAGVKPCLFFVCGIKSSFHSASSIDHSSRIETKAFTLLHS